MRRMKIMEKRIELKIGNILDRIKEIRDNSIDCIVTSPPYYGLRSYKGAETIWGGNPECKHEWNIADHKYRSGGIESANTGNDKIGASHLDYYSNTCSKCGAWKGQLGLEPDYKMYLSHLLIVTSEIKRVLKPTGTLWWNMGDSYSGSNQGSGATHKSPHGIQDVTKGYFAADTNRKTPLAHQDMPSKSLMQLPTRFAIRMVDEQGWILRNMVIWKKRNPMPSSVRDRLTNSYEFIFFFTKQKHYFFNLDAIRVPSKTGNGSEFGWAGMDNKRMGGNAQATTQVSKHILKNNVLGKNPGNILELTTQPFKGAHFAVFPPKLPEFCIKAGCPEEVCSVCGKPKVHVYEKISIVNEEKPLTGKHTLDTSINSPGNRAHYITKERKYTVNQKEIAMFIEQYLKKEKIEELNKAFGETRWPHWIRTDDSGAAIPSSKEYKKLKEVLGLPNDHDIEMMTVVDVSVDDKGNKQKIIGTQPTCSCNASFKPGVVLDPFAGSGTTMFVAKQLGRSAIGIEISPEYAKIIKQRLEWGLESDIQWVDDIRT